MNNIYDFKSRLSKIEESIKQKYKSFDYILPTDNFIGIDPIEGSATVMTIRFYVNNRLDNKSHLEELIINEINEILKCNQMLCKVNVIYNTICVIFRTPKKTDVNTVIDDAARVNSLISIFNKKLNLNINNRIQVYIAISYGSLIMRPNIENNRVRSFSYNGPAIEEAYNLLEKNNSKGNIIISFKVWNNILLENQRCFTLTNYDEYAYSSIVNVFMNNYVRSFEK